MKKRLPIDLIRNMPLHKQSRYTLDYHALCTAKYDWFVRTADGDVYYTNEDRSSIDVGGCEVFGN